MAHLDESLHMFFDQKLDSQGSCSQSHQNNESKIGTSADFAIDEAMRDGHLHVNTKPQRKTKQLKSRSLMSELQEPSLPNRQFDLENSDQIFHSDEDNQCQQRMLPQGLNQNNVFSNQSGEQGKRNPEKERKKDKSSPKKQNNYATKNMVQFFFKTIKNYFEKFITQENSMKAWAAFMEEYEYQKERRAKQKETSKHKTTNFSLEDFTNLFQINQLRNPLSKMFRSRYLFRAIAGAGIKPYLKKQYRLFIPKIVKGFKLRKLERLHD